VETLIVDFLRRHQSVLKNTSSFIFQSDEANEEVICGSDNGFDNDDDFVDIVDGEQAEENNVNSMDECDSVSSVDDERSETNEPLADLLERYGMDYNSLLTVVNKYENGNIVKYKPPLTPSLFANMPPTINFVTQDQKCMFIRDPVIFSFYTAFGSLKS
jgi:hypothetical protein